MHLKFWSAMHISIIGGYCGGLKVFHLWLFLPCTIFLYDTRYLLHLLVLEHPDVNRLLSDLGFYVAKPFRHCYLVHNCKGIKKRTLIFKVNNAFPLKIERFSQFFHGKTFWIFPRFCWPQSAQHQHTVTFSLKKIYLTILSATAKCNFGIFVGKICEEAIPKMWWKSTEKTIYIPFMQQQVSIKAYKMQLKRLLHRGSTPVVPCKKYGTP